MKVAVKRSVAHIAPAYVTKRVIISASRSAVRSAADRAMRTAGYLIMAHNGWLIRQNIDGTIQRLEKYRTINRPHKVVID
jgi:hypothetical protein